MGVVIYMYLKHSIDYINSSNIWAHGSNSLGVFVAEIPFLAFLAFLALLDLHRKWSRCGQVEPSPCYSQSEVV